MEKDNLRKSFIDLRRQLDQKDVLRYSHKIIKRLQSEFINNYKVNLFTYVSMDHEVYTHELIQDALDRGLHVAVPKTEGSGNMKFYGIHSFDELELGRFNVLEPKTSLKEIKPNEETLFIVPGLAFDLKLNRLGYGGGYYDRYLNQHNTGKKIGLAYDFQIVEDIPTGEWDIPLDFVITPNRMINDL